MCKNSNCTTEICEYVWGCVCCSDLMRIANITPNPLCPTCFFPLTKVAIVRHTEGKNGFTMVILKEAPKKLTKKLAKLIEEA